MLSAITIRNALCFTITMSAVSHCCMLFAQDIAPPPPAPAYEAQWQYPYEYQAPTMTAEQVEEEKWKLKIMPYLWAASLKGTLTVKDVPAEADVSFGDIFRNLDYAVIGQAELHKGRFFLYEDTVLLKLSHAVSVNKSRLGRFGLTQISGTADVSAEATQLFQEFMAGYRFYEQPLDDPGISDRKISFDLMGGGRYYYIDADITAKAKVRVNTPLGEVTRERSGSISGSTSWIDPVIGGRMKYDATDRLELTLQGDVGGFGVGSEFAWGARAMAEYEINDCWDVVGGYRVLDIKYEDGPRGLDARMAGPMIGMQYRIDF